MIRSNIQIVNDGIWSFFSGDDTMLSTSIDGDLEVHSRQRTDDIAQTQVFLSNLASFVERFGPNRLSALPTINVQRPPDLGSFIDVYGQFGISSIYLRPINRQAEIVGADYDLSTNRYEKVVHEAVEHRAPKEIIAELKPLQAEIANGPDKLEAML